LIINAGIEQVIIRDTRDAYRVIPVEHWITNDESLTGVLGY
jgi:dCMP deaminase